MRGATHASPDQTDFGCARWVNRERSTMSGSPRLRSRPKLTSDQTQSSAHPCVPRPKLQGLFGSSSALRSDHGLEMV